MTDRLKKSEREGQGQPLRSLSTGLQRSCEQRQGE